MDGFESLIAQHLARRPAMEPADVYKLLYQGVRGPEHVVASPTEFGARLAAEWDALAPGEDDPLTEPVRPDGAPAGFTRLQFNLMFPVK